MKRIGKVYDFEDFCVRMANHTMKHDDFRQWESGLSVHKLKSLLVRPNMANKHVTLQVTLKRGSYCFFFKSDFSEDSE